MSETPSFRRVLIANRGEIAVRIAQTCREMGIRTIAVYSEAEEQALHVRACDEAHCIGRASPLESYLVGESIIAAAKEHKADAIHPGYGFLAESADFARAVIAAGLVWIGPSPEAVALMGDKVAAKALAQSIGVPVIPGYEGDDRIAERMAAEADRIGFPLMVKAAAGGGGRGMRIVSSLAELAGALEGARREARSAFADERVFLEKLITAARHIEIQVLLDAHGAAIYLGERDCSIQRRHQKVIEETPSPVLDSALRAAMGEAALRLARAAGYTNAGTVEFLLGDDRFYFLEMNARIQVEHPVTEVVTGLDLIRLQLQIAANQPLGLSQLDIRPRGHAIEARIFAEDAQAGFLPSAGTLHVFRPPSGPGVRNDVGVEEGSVVTPFYDAMLAKLIVHAEGREAAVARLQRALAEYRVSGVVTNLGFLRWIASSAEFVRGRTDIGYIDRCWESEPPPSLPPVALVAAAIVESLAAAPVTRQVDADQGGPWTTGSHWRLGSEPRSFSYRYGDTLHQVQLTPLGSQTWLASEGDGATRYELREWRPPQLVLADAQTVVALQVERSESADDGGPAIAVDVDGRRYALTIPSQLGPETTGVAFGSADVPRTPMPGTIVRVMVTAGQRVQAHEPLAVLEAMKMEHIVHASRAGVVKRVLVAEGEPAAAGSPVVELESVSEREVDAASTNVSD